MFEGWSSPFAEANQQTQDRNNAWNAIKNDPGTAALFAGLSMLSNNNGRRSFGQLVGRAGFDALSGLGAMEAQRRAQARYEQEQQAARDEAALKRQKDEFDMFMAQQQYALDRDKYQLDKRSKDAEQRGWEMLNSTLGGGMTAPADPGGGTVPDMPIWKRNNNPGNLRNVGGDGFQTFPSIEDGVRGMGRQLDLYYGRDGLKTVRGIVSKYAPPNENQTDAYVSKVARELGVDPDAPLNWDPATKSRLMSSMMHMETGQSWAPDQVGSVLGGGSFSSPTGDGPLAPPVIPDSAKKKPNPYGTGLVGDDVPKVKTQGSIPTMFGGVDRATLERVALMSGDAGAAARQILGMRKDAFGAHQPKIGDVSDLGKRWLSESKNFLAMMESANQLLASAKENSAAGDIGMIFTFMKALDPTSVVRENEQASAQNAAGVPERVRNVYNNLLTGQRLSPKQRNEFISFANRLVKASMPEQERRNKYFTDLSNAYNISPSLVVRDFYPGLTDVIDSYLALPIKDDVAKEYIPGVPSGNVSSFAGNGAGGGGGGGVGAGTGGPMKDISDDDLLTALGLK